MSKIALRVENLGKRYRLGVKYSAGAGMYRYKSLRDTFGNLARRPLAAARGALSSGLMTDDNAFWALREMSFEVRQGEVVGIIGRNGAGKSTLLKVLSHITKPTTGRVDLFGRVGSLLEVGTGFHPELSGRENIFLNGAILGMTRAEVRGRFDEIVAFSEIERFLDTPVKQYSSGMYTRLAFAVAAHLEPEILVVDEVLAVGDAAFQKKCLGKMQSVADQGRTVLFVSHNIAHIQRLCSTAIILDQGRLLSTGSVASQVEKYTRLVMSDDGFTSRASVLPGIDIVDCRVEPTVFQSGQPCTVTLTLQASQRRSIEDLCLFICANHDARVVALDLHSRTIPANMEPGERRTHVIRIPSVQLVDREYSIGLFIRSDAGYDAVYGLCQFELMPTQRVGSPRYMAEDRGFAELPYEAEYAGGSEPVSQPSVPV